VFLQLHNPAFVASLHKELNHKLDESSVISSTASNNYMTAYTFVNKEPKRSKNIHYTAETVVEIENREGK
jgi:hypothetical protein